jgi:hypothetical protein
MSVSKNFDAQIDRLYQLPLDEFTAARNALAKEAGPDGAAIKQLAKPPLAAWAVNQLYWERRAEYQTLVDAAERMRKTHKAVIEGRRGDLRSAGREHELALETALKATLDVLKGRGQPVTEASRHAILNTLRALPANEPPGLLSGALAPGGFEMLAGITPARGHKIRGSAGPQVRGNKGPTDQRTPGPKDLSQDLKAQRQREAAERAARDAEHRARRAEFETARAVREATKAEKRLAEARLALETAQEEAAAAEREAAAAVRAREAAERKLRDAASALETARAAARRT